VQGNLLRGTNITLNYLISFAYEVHPKLIIGTPPWAGTDEFGIEAKPEGEGAPNEKQWQGMLQKVLPDRFKLAFHREKKELPVCALSVGKTGPKLTKSGGDPNGPPALEFGARRTLHATNATMADFTRAMQAVVLDRPVVDQTGLKRSLSDLMRALRSRSEDGTRPVDAAMLSAEAKRPGIQDAEREMNEWVRDGQLIKLRPDGLGAKRLGFSY
jgi:uncharacterized protein (TIGR03435 family)